MKPRRPIRRGFTLIEAISTLTILATIGSLSTSIIFTAMDGFLQSAVNAQLHAEESIALDRLSREFRKIPRDPNVVGVAPKISSVTATSMNWDSNYSLSLSGNQLIYVNNGAPSEVLLGSVTAFNIQTFDEDNAALGSILVGPACNPIRRIEIIVTQTRHNVSQTLISKVFIRSTMSGGGT